jgi:Bacterial alpha-L-rhamnosidase 6 hairpin glycosidase domain
MIRQKPRSRVAVLTSPQHRSLPSYSLSEFDLETGVSLGNSAIWLDTQANGAIERIFSLRAGKNLMRSVVTRYGATGGIIREPARARAVPTDVNFIGLNREEPARVEIHPCYQRRRFVLGGTISVSETVFVPLDDGFDDDPVAYTIVELRGIEDASPEIRFTVFARLRGDTEADVTARYDPDLRALVATNAGDPRPVRILGFDVDPTSYATTTDFGMVYERAHAHQLSSDCTATGDIIGALSLDFRMTSDHPMRIAVLAAVYSDGEAAAIESFRNALDAKTALAKSEAHLCELAHTARVYTPDHAINEGALWSKVNMRRVMGSYPCGRAFTNEPGKSSNIVMRDAAWFVYGCDHFSPEFSRALLDKFAELQYPDGKLAEYFNALDGRAEDYGLNINDGTPLFILAVNHHFRATGDEEWLARMYPAVTKAARCIIAQTDDRHLVVCTADDPRGNVWAIAGWRNIIDGYKINGAVTELNAECAAALRAAAHLAENLHRPVAEAKEFRDAYERLRAAMDEHLLNPDTGLYYLNIGLDGVVHTDVTGDELFPVMFRVCDDQTGFRIISRLNSADFWTQGGLRTASRNDPLYHPSSNNGLIGGVWPGLTWWYAFAAARFHPEFMVRALRSSFNHYAANPKVNNTTPGQFSEWFDGESMINRGLRLSPWEPPRFLWAAIEGVCGLMLTTKGVSIDPVVPHRWRWIAARCVRYHGDEISYFAVRQSDVFHLFGTGDIAAGTRFERFDEDVSDDVTVFSQSAVAIAFRRGEKIAILVGNHSDSTATVPVNVSKLVDASARYRVRVYNSERDGWEEPFIRTGSRLASLASVVETFGFRLIEVQPAP